MEARVHQNTAEFRDVAWPLLAADPVKYTVILTATAKPIDGALLITLHDKGSLVGAALQTGVYPMIVTAVPAHVAEFAAGAVHDLMPDLAAASGTEEELEAFVAAWTARTGKSAEQTMATRLFQLGELRPPQAEGTAREVTEDDLPLMTEWLSGFLIETLPPPGNRAQADTLAKAKFEPDEFCLFWEINGTPVAMAAGRGPISGMSRIAPVYTPPDQRGRGYASAVTAAVTQIALDRGSDQVLIFTDLANPTTNHIYPAIGYEPVGDSAEYKFS